MLDDTNVGRQYHHINLGLRIGSAYRVYCRQGEHYIAHQISANHQNALGSKRLRRQRRLRSPDAPDLRDQANHPQAEINHALESRLEKAMNQHRSHAPIERWLSIIPNNTHKQPLYHSLFYALLAFVACRSLYCSNSRPAAA